MAEIGCNWARIGPSKSSQSLSIAHKWAVIQSRNSGNDGRNTRCSYVQEEVIEGTNIQNDAGNIQRTFQTTSSGTAVNVQCYNCSEKVILTDEQNDFLFADASRMEEIEELSIVDSGCSKHLTGDHLSLKTFVEKFMITVRFGNDHFAVITGYEDYVQEVAFRSNTCYVRNLEGDDLLTGAYKSNLYIISILIMAPSSPICLLSKATSTKSWLWHHILSHLNFSTINNLTKNDLVDGLPKFKYSKDHLCSACERVKSKKSSHLPKVVPSIHSKLELLHMDLCGPMQVASINGKKYILVIVDDYSRFT
ncbi:retrovirus-related pol polyprotein from transposon TNT 1-94 [Tanacetum coccineum]